MCAIPLNCHTTSGSFQRDSAGAGHSCHRFRLHDRRASSTFSGPVRRSWVSGIVSFHSHRNLQDLNLRSLPLSVKRRIPPRPRFRMPPSFRGVNSLAFGANCLMPVKGDVAAWRARPSGPDVWADALVRRIALLLPPRTRAGGGDGNDLNISIQVYYTTK